MMHHIHRLLVWAAAALLAAAPGLAPAQAPPVAVPAPPAKSATAPAPLARPGMVPSAAAKAAAATGERLEESRLKMEKWVETQRVLAEERKNWQEDKKILTSRLELAKSEIADLEAKLAEAQGKRDKAGSDQGALLADKQRLEETNAHMGQQVAGLEAQLHAIHQRLPEPVKARLAPLYQRVPADPAAARVSVTERYQNVLGIMNELNKANNDLSSGLEVQTLAGGKPAEVKTIYVGLGQAYYLSARGEAGVGRPGPRGWVWEPIPQNVKDMLMAFEILEGKHVPGFVPLPVKIQ